jgi:hypothetical protein
LVLYPTKIEVFSPSGYECDERDNLCHAKGNLGGLGSLVSEAAKERLIDELLEQIAKRRDLDQFLRRAGGYSGGRRTSAGGGGYRESNRGTSSTMNNKKRVPGKSKKKYSLISESWEPQLDDDLAGEEAQLDNNSHAIHTTTS